MARRILNVFLKEALVGQLEQDNSGATRFRYAPEWLDSPAAVPISTSLPLHRKRFSQNENRPFFAGVLPEEGIRRLVAKTFGVSDKNDFALLERIGAECAEAVSVLPQGELPMATKAEYREISSDELAAKLLELPRRPLLAGEQGIRLSLAGAQGKLALKINGDRFYLPLNGSPSNCIIKPQSSQFEGLVESDFSAWRWQLRQDWKPPRRKSAPLVKSRFFK